MVCKRLLQGPQTAHALVECMGRSPHSRGILTWCLGPVTVVVSVVLSGAMIRECVINQPCHVTRVMLAHDARLSSWQANATGRARPPSALVDAAHVKACLMQVIVAVATNPPAHPQIHISLHHGVSLNDRAG